MEISIYENVVDELTGQKVSIENNTDEIKRVRITVKEGVTSINFYHIRARLRAIDDGISNTLIRSFPNESIPVGEEITLYMAESDLYMYRTNRLNLGTFLSNVKTLHDPLPFLVIADPNSNTVVIDSEEFEAPNGVFDHINSVTFNGSSFKKGPRIFSERAMETTPTWPYNASSRVVSDVTLDNYTNNVYYAAWRPFNNCPNLESIEPQGTLGPNLKYVLPCDLVFYGEDGTANLSAYPKMEGTPTHIIHYIGGDRVRTSSIPNDILNTAKCTHLYYPLSFNEYILDSVQVPLAGIDIGGKDMALLSLDSMQIVNELNTITPEYKDHTLSLAHFGIMAPKSTNVCENLHMLYMNITEEREQDIKGGEDWIEWKKSQKNHLLTPQTIKDHISEEWGTALEEIWESEYVDEYNQIPAMPTGVQRLMGYMNKEFMVNDFIKPDEDEPDMLEHVNYYIRGREDGFYGDFSLVQRYMQKDGEPFHFKPRVLTLVGDRKQITNLYRNLYANTIVDEPITVPKLQDDIKYLLFAYAGMFSNSTGLDYHEYRQIRDKYTPILMHTKSRVLTGRNINTSEYPMYITKDIHLNDEFFLQFNRANSKENYACVEGILDEDFIPVADIDPILPHGFYNDTTSYAYDGYGDELYYADGITIERIGSRVELAAFIQKVGNQELFLKTKRFNHDVTFEPNNLTGLIASAYCAHQMYYGSNPHFEKGSLVPIIPDTGKNARNYYEAFKLNYAEFKMQRPTIIQGYFETDDEFLHNENFEIITNAHKWAIILYFDNLDISDIDPSFSIGETIIPQLPPSREIYQTTVTGDKVQQFRGIIPEDLILEFENRHTELQDSLSIHGIATPFTEFFGENTNNLRDPEALIKTFTVGLGINSNKMNRQHELKNPNGFTEALLRTELTSCNMSDYALRTFAENDPFDRRYGKRNEFNIEEMPDGNQFFMTPSTYS